MSKATGIYTVNLAEYSLDGQYEVHADGGLMITTSADNAGAAKRVARSIWNDDLSQKEAEELEYYRESA